MLKKYISVTVALIIINCHFVAAQQEYQLSDYGGPGTIYLYNRLSGVLPVQEIIKSGADVTWDISAFAELNTHPTQLVTPSQGIDQATFVAICTLSGISFLDCFSIWGQTEQTLLLNDSLALFGLTLVDLQLYQNKTSNFLLENFFGFTVDFEGTPTQAVIVYQKPDTIFHFPITYNDSWTSDINWGLDLSPAGINIMYSSHQVRSTEVEAWGTLMTPFDTFTNVIRVRSEIAHSDTLYTDTLDLPVNITQLEYMWFDTSYKLPVMIANGIVTDTLEIINIVEYIYDATCAAPAWSVDTGSDVFYLDSSGSVTINFEISGSNANLYEWDFGDGQFETSEGSISHAYSSAGSYSVGVSGCMTNCLPLNSCSGQIIDFEIIDTITSIRIFPGEHLGLKLFPNPVSSSFTIEIPDRTGTFDYQIMDMAGRKVAQGVLNEGLNKYENQLENGVYSMHIRSSASLNVNQVVLRFIVCH